MTLERRNDFVLISEKGADIFRLSLELQSSHLKFYFKESLVTDLQIEKLTDGKDHYVCYALRSVKDLWKVIVDGKDFKSGALDHLDITTKVSSL